MDSTNSEQVLEQIVSELLNIKNQVAEIKNDINTIKNKMSMPNGVAQIKNAKFFLPNYPADCIQKYIVDYQTYWFTYDLEIIDNYLPENAVILDIGSNIGSYSLYWAIERHAKKIYAFEPQNDIFDILCTNIRLNNLAKVIKPYKIGLSNQTTKASIDVYHLDNIGGTSFKKDKYGQFLFKALDSFKIKEHIDVMKIDVEGNEVDVLEGAINTIKKNHPLIIIETLGSKDKVDEILIGLNYEIIKVIHEGADYIYKYKG